MVAKFLEIPTPSPKYLQYSSHSLDYVTPTSHNKWQPHILLSLLSSETAHCLSTEYVSSWIKPSFTLLFRSWILSYMKPRAHT